MGVVTPLRGLIWVGLAGCLAYAWVDFPFQIPSVAALFCVLIGVASVLARERDLAR
jgi:hypothetical protein